MINRSSNSNQKLKNRVSEQLFLGRISITMLSSIRNRFVSSSQDYEERFINSSDCDKSDIKPSVNQDLVLSEAFIGNAIMRSKKSIREVALEVSKRIVDIINNRAEANVIHFVGSFLIDIAYSNIKSHKLDPSKFGLMKEAVGEFLPKDFLCISGDGKKIRFVIGNCESQTDSEPGLLLSPSQLVEIRARSKSVSDRRLRTLAKETTTLLKNTIDKMSNDGTLSFSDPFVVISFPYPASDLLGSSTSSNAVKAFETILRESIPDRTITTEGVTHLNKQLRITLHL